MVGRGVEQENALKLIYSSSYKRPTNQTCKINADDTKAYKSDSNPVQLARVP